MRTNLALDETLLAQAKSYSQAKTKKVVVEEALRTFIEVKAAQQRLTIYREGIQALESQLRGIRLQQSPRDLLREGRDWEPGLAGPRAIRVEDGGA